MRMPSSLPATCHAVLWRVIACLAVGLSPAQAEPVRRIFDSSHLLSPAAHDTLALQLEAFSVETGCAVFVKAETFLESGLTARAAARSARQSLVTSGPAALFLSDRAKDSIAISQSPDLWQRYPMARLVENLRAAMAKAQLPDSTPEQRLTACVEVWLAGIRRLEVERRATQQVIPPSQRPLTLVYASLLGVGTLAALLLGRRDRLSLAAEQHQILFPDVLVGQRLGAPHGGGVIASLSASDAPQPPGP
jgi:hypothetical protein